MTDGGQDFDLGQVVGSAGEKGDDGSTVWNTSTAPTYANSKYTFNISNLSGKTGLQIAVNDIIFYSTYYYIVSNVNSTTVDCSTRVSIKGSDASVTIVDNLTSTSSTSALSAKQGKVLNDNKIETSSIATSFGSTPSDSKVPSEKLTKNTLDGKAPTSHASSANTYGLGSTSNYGHVKTINGLTQSSHSDGTALSAYQGKVLKDAIDAKPDSSDIPTKTSDLTNDSNYISTSSTNGLIKNDGTIDTTSYSTFSGSYNDLSNKPTIPSASSTTPSADTTSGSYGSGTSYARSNHTHPKSSLYAEATHSHTKSQITDFPSIPSKTSDLTNDGADGTNVFVANNDSRLSDARTPTSHTHTKSQITDFPTIPSKISDLTNDSDFIETSSTEGVIANDGSIIGIGTTQGTVAAGNHTHSNYISGTKVTSWSGSVSDSNIPSEKLVKNTLDDKISKSSTAGLIKNDGSVDTNTYLTSSALSNYIQKSNTSGLIKNDGTIDTSTYLTQMKIGSTSGLPVKTGTNGVLTTGSFGTSAGTFAEGNHSHSGYVSATKVTSWQSTPSDSNVPSEKLVKNSLPTKVSDLTNDSGFITSSAISGMLTSSDIADNLTTNDSTKVLSAKQGKALKDLIGAAITYINQ